MYVPGHDCINYEGLTFSPDRITKRVMQYTLTNASSVISVQIHLHAGKLYFQKHRMSMLAGFSRPQGKMTSPEADIAVHDGSRHRII